MGNGGKFGSERLAHSGRNAQVLARAPCAALPREMLGSVFGKGGARVTEPVARTRGSDQA